LHSSLPTPSASLLPRPSRSVFAGDGGNFPERVADLDYGITIDDMMAISSHTQARWQACRLNVLFLSNKEIAMVR
jgi:hypothetical protein